MAKKTTKQTNPNGSNQYLLDPRQKLMWDFYINPKSATFGNAYQSALQAGYEDSSATLITTTQWFIEKYRRLNFVSKAEKNLDEALDGNMDDPERGAKIIKWKATEFSLKTLGKEEGYNEFNPADSITLEQKEKLLSLLK